MGSSKPVVEYRYYDLPEELPLRVFTGSDWTISDVLSKRLHFHNCLEIGFCHSHSGFMLIDGKRVPFSEGDAFIIPRMVPHTTCSDAGTRSRWSYIFTDIEGMTGRMETGFPPGIRLERDRTDRMRFLCECILDECTKKTLDTDLIRIYFSALQIEYGRFAGKFGQMEQPEANFNIRPVLRYMDTHYSSDFNMDQMAELCLMSPAHFRRSFQETMGTSPLKYLNQLRIRKACMMLSIGNDSVLNIAEAVGLPSVSSFNRNFLKETGMSPREYRRNNAKAVRKGERNNVLRLEGWTRAESRPETED